MFKTPLSKLEAEAGETVIFRCVLNRQWVPVVWRKDQKILQSSNKHQLRQDGAVVELVIYKLQEADSGEYSCDSGHETTSARLTVKGKNQCYSFLTRSSHVNLVFLPFHAWFELHLSASFLSKRFSFLCSILFLFNSSRMEHTSLIISPHGTKSVVA